MSVPEGAIGDLRAWGSRPPVIGVLTSIGATLDAFFVEIVAHWRAQGAVVEVAAGTRAEGFAAPTVLPSVTRAPSPRNRDAPRALRRWVRDAQLDLVITNTATASMLVRAAGVGVPVIYFCHGLHWNHRRLADLPYQMIERALLPRTDGIVCLNSADEAWFARHAPRHPRLRLRGGVGLDTDRFVRRPMPRWGEGLETLRLLWCGEFTVRKDPGAAVALATLLHRRGLDVTLDMLGEGPLLEAEATRSSVPGLVRCHGRQDVVPFLEGAHVLVQTSRWEGLPRIGLEALAIGRPVVGFDVKGVRDLPAVQLAPVGDLDALADAVLAAARGAGPALPPASTLSVVHAADRLGEFARSVGTGDFPRGTVYAA